MIVASISFRHVVKRYAGNTVAVKDFNAEVADKEFLVRQAAANPPPCVCWRVWKKLATAKF
jgi:hypothetical protein